MTAAVNGSHIHTNSWGASVAGQYNTNSMQTDHSARNHSGMLILFAAGNAGTDANSNGEVDDDSMGSPATSKNVLTVGASENNRSTITSEWGAWWPETFLRTLSIPTGWQIIPREWPDSQVEAQLMTEDKTGCIRSRYFHPVYKE